MWQWCLLDCDTVSQLTLSACEFAKSKTFTFLVMLARRARSHGLVQPWHSVGHGELVVDGRVLCLKLRMSSAWCLDSESCERLYFCRCIAFPRRDDWDCDTLNESLSMLMMMKMRWLTQSTIDLQKEGISLLSSRRRDEKYERWFCVLYVFCAQHLHHTVVVWLVGSSSSVKRNNFVNYFASCSTSSCTARCLEMKWKEKQREWGEPSDRSKSHRRAWNYAISSACSTLSQIYNCWKGKSYFFSALLL